MELEEWEVKFLEDLKEFEGLRLKPYNDSEGFATIGYGHLIAERPYTQQDVLNWKNFTKSDAESLLIKDMQIHNNEALKTLPWLGALDDVRKTVLFGMAFQLGIPRLLTFKNTLKSVKSGDYEDAAYRISTSLWAKQTPNRVNILIERLRTGIFE